MHNERDVLEPLTDYTAVEAGSFLAQLDDQSARLKGDLAGITADELAWQPAPGLNTIGMLLAHIAIVEVFWTQIGLRGDPASDSTTQLGIGMDDDGMPIPDGAAPPANLAGKPWPYYEDLLDRGRAYVKQTATRLTDADITTVRTRTRKNGQRQELNVRWVLYHLLEHFAGHYGQILLLRHQYRVTVISAQQAR